MEFAKAHEARNAFLLLLDMPARLDMTTAAVAALCDQRRGVGAGGVVRVTIAGSAREAGLFDDLPDGVTEDDWFLDSYGAAGQRTTDPQDGFRTITHFLWATGLERRDEFVVGALNGARQVTVHSVGAYGADITVGHHPPTLLDGAPRRSGGRHLDCWTVGSGTRHFASVNPGLTEEQLVDLDFEDAVAEHGEKASGAEITVLTELQNATVQTRTRRADGVEAASDSGGALVAAAATLRRRSNGNGFDRVVVAYGREQLIVTPSDGAFHVRGPSTLVARGDLSRDWWRAAVAS